MLPIQMLGIRMKFTIVPIAMLLGGCASTTDSGAFVQGTVYDYFLAMYPRGVIPVEACNSKLSIGSITSRNALGLSNSTEICSLENFGSDVWGYLNLTENGNWFCRELTEKNVIVGGSEEAGYFLEECNLLT